MLRGFVVDLRELRANGYSAESEEARTEIDGRIRGFVTGAFSRRREREYAKMVDDLDLPENSAAKTPDEIFDAKSEIMVSFLEVLRNESLRKEARKARKPKKKAKKRATAKRVRKRAPVRKNVRLKINALAVPGA